MTTINIGSTVLHQPHKAAYSVLCRVVDTRVFMGRHELKIEPMRGTGSMWVRATSLTDASDFDRRKQGKP